MIRSVILPTNQEGCPCGCSLNLAKDLCPTTFCFGSTYMLKECASCGTAFFYPQPSVQELQVFYSTHGYEINHHSQAGRARRLIADYLEHRQKGKFLDIGCSTGVLIQTIKEEAGWEVHGVELSEKAANFAKNSLGLSNVLHRDIESAKYPDAYFDAVHISEVLEHVTNPLALLKECRRILKPSGLFFLSLPNGTADRQGLIDYWQRFKKAPGHASGHIFFFSSLGLETMLKKSGLEILETRTYAFKQGLRALRLFPKRSSWEGMFEPRAAPEVLNLSKISIKPSRYPKLYYRFRYGLRQRLWVSGLRRFGLGWDLVLKPSAQKIEALD